MTTTYQDGEVTLGDKSVETSQYERYKGRKGVVDRIAILSSKLVRGYRYYHQQSRTSFKAPTNNPALMDLLRAAMGEPEQRFGLILFHYLTDDAGNLIDTAKCQGKPKLWSISEVRYEELSALNRSWPLMDLGPTAPQMDIQIRCTEEQYQRMTFTPMPQAHWKSKTDWYDKLKDREQKGIDKLKQSLGKSLTDSEIMALIGAAPANATGSTANAGQIDLSDITDELS